jgi:GNAT superfamily N-acetyltransferase
MLADRPDLLEGMYEVARLTYPEVGGYQAKQAQSLHEWQLYHLGSPGTALDMTPIAIAAGKAIGFATLVRHVDGRSAEHRICAVLPEWRRRGVATLLLQAQLAAAKRDALETVIAWGRGEHAGQNYGTKLGFEPRGETVAFRGPLQ